MSADAIGTDSVFGAFTAWEQMTKIGITKESEPCTVVILLAASKALDFIFWVKNGNFWPVGAFSRHKTLEVRAVSRIWNRKENKQNWKKQRLHCQIDFIAFQVLTDTVRSKCFWHDKNDKSYVILYYLWNLKKFCFSQYNIGGTHFLEYSFLFFLLEHLNIISPNNLSDLVIGIVLINWHSSWIQM